MPIKKSKMLKMLSLILVIFSTPFLHYQLDNEFNEEDNFNYENINISGISGRIHVNNNWSAAKAAGICTGQGTLADPYVIQDLIIDGEGTEYGILIENANQYFEVKNCSVFNSDTYPGSGIRLSNVENGIIEYNNCSFNNRGIRIESSSQITVRNNILYENGFGIELWSSYEIILLKNNCSKSYQAVHTYSSSDCTLNENIIKDSEYGINLYGSARMTLLENLMENCGIVCDASKTSVSSHNIDETNLVNGKPVRYYSSQTGIYVPSNTGQLIMADCSFSTVENLNINNVTDAIEILYCSNITVTANNCSFNTRNGILLDHSYNNTIYANNCSNNGDGDGIDLSSSEENLVSENNCFDNRNGIYLYGSDKNKVEKNNVDGINLNYADYNNIKNNTCNGIVLSYAYKSIIIGNIMSKGGITCWGSKEIVTSLTIDASNLVNGNPVRYYVNQSYITVPYNTGQVILANCNSSTIEHLDISNTNVAINILYSSNNTILENNCTNNSDTSINLYYSDNNTISKNNCSANFYRGISLLYCESNTIRENLCDLSFIGIGSSYSSNNKFIENNCSKNEIGIFITSCKNAFVTGNMMQECGLTIYGTSIEYLLHSIDITNLVNGKPVYYYFNQSNIIVPQNAGQVIMVNCTSSIIKNTEVSQATNAITVSFSSNITISENFCSENNFSNIDYFPIDLQPAGIRIYQCRNMNVSRNICSDNNIGIFIFSSENSSFIENNCSGNYFGTLLFGYNLSMIRNNCTDNEIGFLLYGSNNLITENNILNNVYGMQHGNSINNEIYLNNFINDINCIQMEESSNFWNSPNEITYNYSNQVYNNYLGNYWDDYNGNDVDGDGIGDVPFNLGKGETDDYPLMDTFEDYLKLPPESLIPFNGMYLNYSFSSPIFGSGPSQLVYSQISPNIFHGVGNSDLWTSRWDVNSFTRVLSNCGGNFTLVNGSHTPIWIFTDINIGDNVLISVDGEGDHTFEVSDEVFITLPGYGILEAWELIDLTVPGGVAIYENSTGILLDGTFYYYGGSHNYTLTLTETNAIEKLPDTSRLIMRTNAVINIRDSPGISDNIITKLAKGSIVQQVENEMNDIYLDGYHWGFIQYGINKGWCAKEFLEEYNILNQNPNTIEDALFTAYHVCYENELAVGPTTTNPQNIVGTFYKEFLYSARGVVMQGSGQAINGKTIKYISGGRGWVDENGIPTYYHSDDNTWRRDDGTVSSPYWIADEESVVFDELPEDVYIGSYWNVYPWYSIAVDRNIIPLGSIVYIEDLDGWSLLNGDKLNGYFMAVDTGSAIVGNRIDMFVGAGQVSLSDWQEILDTFSNKIDPSTNMLKMNITFDSNIQWKIKEAKLKSPGELRIYDTENRTTGMIDNVILNEIPYSRYDHINKIIRIINPVDNFRYVISGTKIGNYGLEISFTENGNYIQFSASEIPISPNELHQFIVDWSLLSTGGDGVNVQIDIDGDGEFDYDFYSDSELSQEEYLDAIEDEPGPTEIPGYNLFVLIGAVCLVVLIIKKQFKNHISKKGPNIN